MASIQFEEFQCSPDVFSSSFPSSPEQVAVFSPGSSSGPEDEHYLSHLSGFYYEPYEQNQLQVKLSAAMANRQKRRAATSAVPMGNPHQLKREHAASDAVFPTHFGHISEPCYPLESPLSAGLSLESFATFEMGSSAAASSLMGYASIPTCEDLATTGGYLASPPAVPPSRVKSTTPNVALLFSLFDVLHAAPPTPAAAPAGARSPPAQVPELPASAGTPGKAFYPAARHFEAPTFSWIQDQEVCLNEYPDHPLSSY